MTIQRLQHLNQLPATAILNPSEITAMFNGLATVINRQADVINGLVAIVEAIASPA